MNEIYVAFVQAIDGRIHFLNATPEYSDLKAWVENHVKGTTLTFDPTTEFWIGQSGDIIKIRPCPMEL